MSRVWLGAVVIAFACSCQGRGAGGAPPGDAAAISPDAIAVDAEQIPYSTVPCDAPQYWPLSIRSASHPAIIHYQSPDQEATAREVLGALDHAWDVEVGTLGFRPPLDDGGRCGPDGAFDVFLWRGHDECFVDVLAENPATPWDDRTAYLVVDPWGSYGGPLLDTTVAHELDHAMQAADDWDDTPIVYEMTSQFIEDLVYDDNNEYVAEIVDFQAHPDWALDYDDGYQTWYMYGSALYLRFLRDHYFAGDGSFIGRMWYLLRSPYGSGEPDFEDALDQILPVRVVETMPDFARWRWYTGAHDDGAHFREGASFAEPARLASVAVASGGRVALSPMVMGSQYVDLTGAGRVTISLADASSLVGWNLQVVPGAHGDGDVLDLSHGAATIDVSGSRTIVVTALPTGAYDPDTRSAEHHHATLVIGAAP